MNNNDEHTWKFLVCPNCHGALVYQNGVSGEGLLCERDQIFYKIEAGIPVMLTDQAVSMKE